MNPGDKAYIIETNDYIREVEVVKEAAGFVTVRYDYTDSHYIDGGRHHLSSKGGFRLRKNRIYESREAAEKYLKDKKKSEKHIGTLKVLDSFK